MSARDNRVRDLARDVAAFLAEAKAAGADISAVDVREITAAAQQPDGDAAPLPSSADETS